MRHTVTLHNVAHKCGSRLFDVNFIYATQNRSKSPRRLVWHDTVATRVRFATPVRLTSDAPVLQKRALGGRRM